MNISEEKIKILETLLNDGLFPKSKDWTAGNLVERVEWLLTMYENVKQERDMLYAQIG